MKISLNWIADYVALPAGLTPKEIAHQLTMSTVEVEGVQVVAGDGASKEDAILEIDNKSLTNRPDLWGHYGIARELAAIYKVPLKPLPAGTEAERALTAAALVGQIDPDVCRRFTATRIENVTVRETPAWMKQRLLAIGQRSKNLYADLTNYVMLTTGQPTHAFDADRLSLPLSVRRATDKEPFSALDGTQLTLTAADFVVADQNGAVGLAGVIGGMDSAIQADTRTVVFEAANFDPLAVRRTAASHGVRTEASTRFEKSLSTHRIDDARRLFFHLLKTIDSGARVTGFSDQKNAETLTGEVLASAKYLCDRIGKQLSTAEMKTPLERLGFRVAVNEVGANDAALVVTVPEWRSTGDVSGAHDLVEEIARLHGYENFEFNAPEVRLEKSARDYQRGAERRVKEFLAFACGMQEVINYPWTEDRFVTAAGLSVDAAPLRLSAPPAPDQATLRTSLVPGLLRAIESNIRWQPAFRIFESGTVFPPGDSVRLDDDREKLPPQTKRIAGAFVGDEAEVLFREAKGAIEALGARAHVSPLATAAGDPASSHVAWADPGACVAITAGGRSIGHLGVLARRGTRAAGLKHAFAVLFEFELDGLSSSPSRENKYAAMPELPSVEVDVSMTYADRVAWADIAGTARGVSPLIAAIEFIDQYRGKGIPEGSRSMTLRARLQPTSQTLTSEEAAAIANDIRKVLAEKLGAVSR